MAYFKTTYTFVVLDQLPESANSASLAGRDASDIERDVTEGPSVLFSSTGEVEEVTEAEMADLLVDAGSEPSFFGIEER